MRTVLRSQLWERVLVWASAHLPLLRALPHIAQGTMERANASETQVTPPQNEAMSGEAEGTQLTALYQFVHHCSENLQLTNISNLSPKAREMLLEIH